MNNMKTLTKVDNTNVWPVAKAVRMQKLDSTKKVQTTDIHVKNLPTVAWRIAKGASTIEGLPIAVWITQAIFEKWERRELANIPLV